MEADIEEPAPSTASDPATGSPPCSGSFWLHSADRLVVLLALFVGIALLGVHIVRLAGWGSPSIEVERLESRKLDYRIDINTANWVEWIQLEGIGEARAHEIVRDREQNGPFTSIDDLTRVKGIGAKTLETIRPWLIENQADSSTEADEFTD